MVADPETKARAIDAELARARDLPTTKRVVAKQPRTIEEDRRRRETALLFSDTPGRLAPLVPMLVDRASGCRVRDLDGNEFIDLHLGFWTGILGHAPPVVVEAIQREAARGTTIGIGHDLEIELCELLVEHVACADMCCLAVSGTSALMHALKLARAARGLEMVAKFANTFHGHADDMVVDLPEFKASALGSDRTLVLPASAEAFDVIRAHADSLACVVVEPAPPMREPRPFFELGMYRELRRLTEELGIVLVFDEVLRGFRSRFGGTLDAEGVIPDLACFGKIVGGGMPLAAVVGRRHIIEVGRGAGNPMRDRDRAPLMGTYAGNRLACAAGIAQLRYLKQNQNEIYPYIRDKGDWLRDEINAHARRHQLPIESAAYVGGMVVVRPAGASHGSPMHPVVLLQTYLRDQGCYFVGGPVQMSPVFRQQELERVSAAFDAAMADIVLDRAATAAA
jgi:glutamate-1-semialdehyde 2,1-aminomutase